MIPNNFGLIKQKEFDLIALNFMDINLDDYNIEVIRASYKDGYGYSSSSSSNPQVNETVTAVTATISSAKYDLILLPIGKGASPGYSGIGTSSTPFNSSAQIIGGGMAGGDKRSGYIIDVPQKPESPIFLYIRCTIPYGMRLPIYGLIKKSV